MTAILQADIDAAAQAAAVALNGGSVSFPGRGWSNGDIQPQIVCIHSRREASTI